jgi:hypothetical protein
MVKKVTHKHEEFCLQKFQDAKGRDVDEVILSDAQMSGVSQRQLNNIKNKLKKAHPSLRFPIADGDEDATGQCQC